MLDALDTAPATDAAPLTKHQRAEAFLKAPPSAKIRLAIGDLEIIERSKTYVVDMETWHSEGNGDGRCYVCLAGSVLANRHAISPHQLYVGPFEAEGPDEFAIDADWDHLLSALDEFKNGYVETFLTMEGTMPNDKVVAFAMTEAPEDPFGEFPDHVEYEANPTGFKSWARSIASKLETIGA